MILANSQQIYQMSLSKVVDPFQKQSPAKIVDRAVFYTTNIGKFHELPKKHAKSLVVRKQAEQFKEHIDYTIKHSQYQLELYRKKEDEDVMRRTSYHNKFIESVEKVEKNEKDIEKKHRKEAEVYEKHLKEIYRRYEEFQRKNRQTQKQEALKLRKELQQFYAKQQERKKVKEFKQISVGTCYQGAIDKLDNIHKKNQEYSQRAQKQLNQELQKNSHFAEMLNKKRRSIQGINNSKSKIYVENLSILSARQQRHIQKYGKNQDGSLQAFKHINEENKITQKRLGEFFKKRVEKWVQQKKRVDAAKAEVPAKCLNILEKTTNASFRQTVSSFKNSAVEWDKTVRMNKSAIRDYDEMKKDEIMSTHMDLRLKNNSSFKVNEKMQSMRMQAKKLAEEYL